jgi:hypothetical protein
MSTTSWIILGVVVVFVIWLVMLYNGLVAMRQRVSQAFADIDVQMKQRHDLIPNLVETVKGYASHERGTLEAVVKARNAAPKSDTAVLQKQRVFRGLHFNRMARTCWPLLNVVEL